MAKSEKPKAVKKTAAPAKKATKPAPKKPAVKAVKNVAKPESKPAMPAKATPKEMADTIITIIRKDLADVVKHGASEAKFRKMMKAMFKAALEAKGIK